MVTTIAADHYLTPVLYKRLKESGAQAFVPADLWGRLRQVYRASAIKSMCLYRELRPALRRLRSSGIKVIVLKGAYLAEAVYGDVAMRPMVDVDLLVPGADLSSAQAILLDMGSGQPAAQDIASIRRRRHHLPRIAIRDLTVEIHRSIVPANGPFMIDDAGLWARARPAMIADVEVLALSPEDLLLHLCLHVSYQHRLAGLWSFCDIAGTIQRFRDEMDWKGFADRARDWGAARHVGLALHLARSMLGAEVPGHVLERLVPDGINRRMLERAREYALAGTGYGHEMPLFAFMRAESLRDKVRLSWERVFMSRAEMASHYPEARTSRHLYCYYARRFRDVIRSFASYTRRRRRLALSSRGRDSSAALTNWLKSR